MFDKKNISSKYEVTELGEKDIQLIYELELGNPVYFEHMKEEVKEQSIRDDMAALPPNTTEEDKFYVGLWENKKLVAVIDLIFGYPNKDTAYIGFFMMNALYQGKNIGTSIINELKEEVKKYGFSYIQLGYIKGNNQSRSFWLKNNFAELPGESKREKYEIISMRLEL